MDRQNSQNTKGQCFGFPIPRDLWGMSPFNWNFFRWSCGDVLCYL